MSLPPETITIDADELYCDGNNGNGALGERLRGAQSEPVNDGGHPRVFLTMNKDGFVDCPYCGRHFVRAAGARKAAH